MSNETRNQKDGHIEKALAWTWIKFDVLMMGECTHFLTLAYLEEGYSLLVQALNSSKIFILCFLNHGPTHNDYRPTVSEGRVHL